MNKNIRSDLTPSLKRALTILLEEGSAIRDHDYWRTPSGRKLYIVTIEALYDRYLVKIVVESRHRRRHTAMLTDVGEYAAEGILNERDPKHISEEAALFIAEVVS